MRSTKIMEIEIGDSDETVTCEVHYDEYYDGIGSYEFWGQRCYDKGDLCLEVENIIPIFTVEAPETQERVLGYIKENMESLISDLEENWTWDDRVREDDDE